MAPKAISPPCAVIVSLVGPLRSRSGAIPDVGLHDPPAADPSAVRRNLHEAASSSFGNRTRL